MLAEPRLAKSIGTDSPLRFGGECCRGLDEEAPGRDGGRLATLRPRLSGRRDRR